MAAFIDKPAEIRYIVSFAAIVAQQLWIFD